MSIKRDPTIAMPDIPHRWRDYQRQRGPVPAIAVVLALALFAACFLFFLPVFLNPGMETDQRTVQQAMRE